MEVPHCFTEANPQYNPLVEISVKNYKQYKRFKCEKRLAWHPIKTQFSPEAFGLLYRCDSVKYYHLQEDVDNLFASYCLDFVTYDFVPCQNVLTIKRSNLERVQNEIYQKAIYKKMSSFYQQDLDDANWYYNYFYYVPILSKKFEKKVDKIKRKKEQLSIAGVTLAKRILDEYKMLLDEIMPSIPNQDDAIIVIQTKQT
jgi:hypothetical protein